MINDEEEEKIQEKWRNRMSQFFYTSHLNGDHFINYFCVFFCWLFCVSAVAGKVS